ncbi:alpha/beta hydrolase [Paeniroseomonas aquatica]|uniref:Alpha/beta fold hydrolase n=1 Tax=Paeniroseomonas aquatica TaxID=373043 RepID=A0ABT8AD33_9PROT|nr:alpha/beta fold hydrolase [Paeniroseomonas aquatica]MDN3567580.1 alpha/beta fold hydrolase [Paeniroseomonas aquatica]
MALLALVGIGLGLARLRAARAGLQVERIAVGEVPATVFRQPDATGPVVVIAHGFAGSQQMMQPFADTLAQAGYVAVTFDFPGHGRNPQPLSGGLRDDAAAAGALLDSLGRVVAATRGLGDGRLALLGHSMASDIVVRWALDRPEVGATVALSLFGPKVTADRPRNLLVVVGAWEPAFLIGEGRRIAGMATPGEVAERTTYGRFADGTARRLVLARGVEHIGVLYSRDSLAAARDWLNQAFGRSGGGRLDVRGGALGLLFGGLLLLAWPLSLLLPRVGPGQGAGLGWRRLWPVVFGPAIVTPLLLRLLPTELLPLLLGDYLVLHFALYGALTAAALWWRGARRPGPIAAPRFALAAAAVAAFGILGFGLPIEAFLTSFWPTPHRLWLVPAMLVGTLPWFLADEWATRGPGAARLAYPATKLAFLLSLLGAVALDPPRLFFLIIIVPVMLVFLTVYGLFGAWANRATGTPLVAATAHALALAWAMAVTFPMVVR